MIVLRGDVYLSFISTQRSRYIHLKCIRARFLSVGFINRSIYSANMKKKKQNAGNMNSYTRKFTCTKNVGDCICLE